MIKFEIRNVYGAFVQFLTLGLRKKQVPSI